jgi:hypothetical protein
MQEQMATVLVAVITTAGAVFVGWISYKGRKNKPKTNDETFSDIYNKLLLNMERLEVAESRIRGLQKDNDRLEEEAKVKDAHNLQTEESLRDLIYNCKEIHLWAMHVQQILELKGIPSTDIPMLPELKYPEL